MSITLLASKLTGFAVTFFSGIIIDVSLPTWRWRVEKRGRVRANVLNQDLRFPMGRQTIVGRHSLVQFHGDSRVGVRMAWESIFTLVVVATMFLALARSWGTTEVILWSALTLLIAVGALMGSDRLPAATVAVTGLGNPGLVTIGFLFVVVEGLSRTGATRWISGPLTRLSGSPRGTSSVLLSVVATVSAFLNNTAVVALFLPVTREISSRSNIAPSRLFLPMCYAATLGGMCTLMGTSTNLVIDGLLRETGHVGLGMFEMAWVCLPIALVGIVYLLIASRWIPDRRPPVNLDDDPREYSVELLVAPEGPLAGKTIRAAGLRNLEGLFLAEIEREDSVLSAPGPSERLMAGDQLVFVGNPDSVVELRKTPGLAAAVEPHYRFDRSGGRVLTEVVVAPKCPMLGTKIRDGNFRGVYDAVVIAVARMGKRVRGKIGDVELQSGDCLLLETQSDFAKKHRSNRHFYLISSLDDSESPRSQSTLIAILIMVAMIATAAFGLTDLLTASMVATIAMLFCRCCTPSQARTAVEWNVLLVIGAALGLAMALQSSGAAEMLAASLLSVCGDKPWLLLCMVYLSTMVATELVTNSAAAAMMFPIAMEAAGSADVNQLPFVIAVMVAASSSFATPFGYQTNMMVAGPGGYRFGDYVRLGLPLNILVMAIACPLIPLVWPF